VKRIVSVSVGSSERNKRTEQEFLGERFVIERIGTDGSIPKAIEIVKDLDGKVDAFGMGGIDLYVGCGRTRFLLREAVPIAQAAKKTPMVDGSGLKATLEYRVIKYLHEESKIRFKGKTVLLVSGIDRFGMAEALVETGCDLILGDLIFVLNLPIPLRSLDILDRVARVVGPIVTKLPFSMIYPTGEKQKERKLNPRQTKWYETSDIIAGDWHYVIKWMPEDMRGKVVITNTTTEEDVAELKRRGIGTLVTTTPEMDGRSFGTNVIEAIIVSLLGKRLEEITPDDINGVLDRLDFKPRISVLNE